jgi:ABC-type spermidine/putrescine transport system permease subunit II
MFDVILFTFTMLILLSLPKNLQLFIAFNSPKSQWLSKTNLKEYLNIINSKNLVISHEDKIALDVTKFCLISGEISQNSP